MIRDICVTKCGVKDHNPSQHMWQNLLKCAELKRGVKMTFDGRGTEKITKGQSLQMSTQCGGIFFVVVLCVIVTVPLPTH